MTLITDEVCLWVYIAITVAVVCYLSLLLTPVHLLSKYNYPEHTISMFCGKAKVLMIHLISHMFMHHFRRKIHKS